MLVIVIKLLLTKNMIMCTNGTLVMTHHIQQVKEKEYELHASGNGIQGLHEVIHHVTPFFKDH